MTDSLIHAEAPITQFLPTHAKITPMLKQWLEAKNKAPDAILLFRMGDFYELFAQDAENAAPILGLALTSRDKDNEFAVAMAGFPHHCASGYIAKLVSKGLKVAVCDQLEDPRACKGIVKRDITRIVTPGTILEEDVLNPKANNFLVGVVEKNNAVAIGALDISTGDFLCTTCTLEQSQEEILRFNPKEILFSGSEVIQNKLLDISKKINCRVEPRKLNSNTLITQPLDRWFEEAANSLAKQCVAMLLHYVQQTLGDISHLRAPKPQNNNEKMMLDATTQAHLDIVGPPSDIRKKGTLLWVLDKTLTAMGGRFLLQRLQYPETNLSILNERFELVEQFMANVGARKRLREILKSLSDIERLVAKCSNHRINPRELVQLRSSLFCLPEISGILQQMPETLGTHIGTLDKFELLSDELGRSLVGQPSTNPKDPDLFQPGYDETLDALSDLCSGGIQNIAAIEALEREKTGINSLKVKFTRVFGYYIEVTRSHIDKVPDYFQRKQTVANAERYVTPELQSLEQQISTAETQRQERQIELFSRLCRAVIRQCSELLATAQSIARLDYYLCLAEISQKNNYVRPQLLAADANKMSIQQGRHPILEMLAQENRTTFVPNDIHLDGASEQIMLLTGPNMGGKSTIMRQVALIQVLAQIGCFVPAKSATLSICDRIFTRVGADDDMVNGRSTFMVEMNEAANILHHASAHSLVILDEIGRGTSTYDGLSLAYAILEHLHNHKKCKTLFATHYHELTLLAESLNRVHNAHVQVQEKNDTIQFLYTLAQGAANRSYGIQVAKLAGLPHSVLLRATQILDKLEQKNSVTHTAETMKSASINNSPQLSFFSAPTPTPEPKFSMPHPLTQQLINTIKEIQLEQMTPMQAFYSLDKIRKLAKEISLDPSSKTVDVV